MTTSTNSTNIFQFEGQRVRHVILEGEPWFVAGDVCRCLGLTVDGGVGRHLGRLRDDEKHALRRRELIEGRHFKFHPFLPLFDKSDSAFTAISESGLYKLVMKAEKTTAKPFQDWVTREVLPSIRKTGSYSKVPEEPSPALPAPTAPAASQVDLAALVDRYEARTDALIGHIGKLVDLLGQKGLKVSAEDGKRFHK